MRGELRRDHDPENNDPENVAFCSAIAFCIPHDGSGHTVKAIRRSRG
jgi:hypothetical protein